MKAIDWVLKVGEEEEEDLVVLVLFFSGSVDGIAALSAKVMDPGRTTTVGPSVADCDSACCRGIYMIAGKG